MAEILETLRRATRDLEVLRVRYALVGGIAVSLRTRPRFTRGVDLSIAVRGDRQAERIIRRMIELGYRLLSILEHEVTGRLVTARFFVADSDSLEPDLDLIFATTGIEREIVSESTRLNVPGVRSLPKARIGHLIAMKVSSATDLRPNDTADIFSLLRVASAAEFRLVTKSLELITRRRYHRGKNL